MKICLLVVLALIATSPSAFAYKYKNQPGYEQDAYGSWERSDRTWTDSDGDGIVNKYDRNNNNSSIW